MKKAGSSFNRICLLAAAFAFVSVPCLFAQYSDSTLNGPWFVRHTVLDTFAVDNLGYLVFDGLGSMADMSTFHVGCSGFMGNYTVQSNDSFSLHIYQSDCNSMTLAGQFNSNSSATFMAGARTMWKVPNPGALADSLIGSVNSTVCGQRNIVLCLDNEGMVTFCAGIDGPIVGRVYADSGLFMGHFKTGDTTTCPGTSWGWSEFSIAGKYSNDTLKGVAYFDESDTNKSGAVLLVRKSAVTSVIKKGLVVEPQQIAFRAGRGGIFFITLKSPINGNLQMQIMDLSGRTVASQVVQCASGSRTAQIDLGRLSRGAYIMRVKAGVFTVQNRIAIE